MVPLLVLLFSAVSESANILILHPIYCGSHEFILRQMGDQLVSHGHEVTQVCIVYSFCFLLKICEIAKFFLILLDKIQTY